MTVRPVSAATTLSSATDVPSYQAVARVVGERTILTPDMGGAATTRQVADEVIRMLQT